VPAAQKEELAMDRRAFVRLLAGVPLAASVKPAAGLPRLHVVTKYQPQPTLGMPGQYPGVVAQVRSDRCVDSATGAANAEVVRDMLARGMCKLTGDATPDEAWRRFFTPADVVGLKVNCGGYPYCISAYEIVAEIVRQLTSLGIPLTNIYVYERFQNQVDECNYAAHLPEGVHYVAAESANRHADNSGYDPFTYVEADFFGEDDTRSNLMRLVTEQLTKIINIPNMKDHRAAGVTGCLKNIAYGSFSNVARTHYHGRSHTYSFVGALAAVEPLRSRTVLQIMDGLRGVWHGGPFARTDKYVFYPKRILIGTDPVAIDRLMRDVIDQKRTEVGALSIFNRSPEKVRMDQATERNQGPDVDIIFREPEHIEYAATLGLGVADRAKIAVRDVAL
jgi:Domain of unknown function (DUF362)